MFKFYLNGTEIVNHPDGWDNISSTVNRDSFSGGLLYDADIKLMAYGGQDLFISLKALWDADRFGKSSFDIYQRSGASGYVLIHAGTIFHSDLNWKLINNAVEFKVEDSSWFAKIKNNKKLEVSLGITISKNKIAIPPAASFQLEVHKVTNGTYYTNKRKAFRIDEALRFLIDWMSDNTIGFESDCFSSGGLYDGYCILDGAELVYHTGNDYPRLSFDQLFEDLRKRFNVQFVMVGSPSAPVIKIEPSSFFYSTDTALTIPDIPEEVAIGVDTGKLYSGVRVGSDKFETFSTLIFPDVFPLISFKEDTLYFTGTNNVESVLDLVGGLVISNSSIHVCLEQLSGYESYDDDTFMIHYNTSTLKTISTDWAGTGHHLYNEPLTNYNILQRYANEFPSDVYANYVGVNTDGFTAVHTSGATPYQNAHPVNSSSVVDGPIQFNDDYTQGNDPGSNYGGSTTQGNTVTAFNSYYTAPSGGTYSFSATLGIDFLGLVTPSSGSPVITDPGIFTAKIQFHKLTGGSVIDTQDSLPIFLSLPGQYTISGSYFTNMAAGDTVEVHVRFENNTLPDPSDLMFVYSFIPDVTLFTCSGIDIGTSTVVANNTKQYKALRMAFKYPLTLDQYNAIRASKSGLISVPLPGNRSVRGWVETVKFEHISGETSFSLITDGNTVYR